jgi:hypothetical protein
LYPLSSQKHPQETSSDATRLYGQNRSLTPLAGRGSHASSRRSSRNTSSTRSGGRSQTTSTPCELSNDASRLKKVHQREKLVVGGESSHRSSRDTSTRSGGRSQTTSTSRKSSNDAASQEEDDQEEEELVVGGKDDRQPLDLDDEDSEDAYVPEELSDDAEDPFEDKLGDSGRDSALEQELEQSGEFVRREIVGRESSYGSRQDEYQDGDIAPEDDLGAGPSVADEDSDDGELLAAAQHLLELKQRKANKKRHERSDSLLAASQPPPNSKAKRLYDNPKSASQSSLDVRRRRADLSTRSDPPVLDRGERPQFEDAGRLSKIVPQSDRDVVYRHKGRERSTTGKGIKCTHLIQFSLIA